MNEDILVSIITPSYNSADFISETIECIRKQTYRNWELLITDDCSSDNTCDIVRLYAGKDPRIKLFVNDKNYGVGEARNNSIQNAKGRFIAFCDSDDCWYPDKLEKQLEFMLENKCALSYTSYVICDEKGEVIGYAECKKEISYRNILMDNGIGCLTAMYDTSLLGKRYMPLMRKRQDWCLWIEILREHVVAKGLQIPLAIYRDRKGGLSGKKFRLLKYNFEVYHKFLKKSAVVSSCYILFCFLPFYFIKKIKQRLKIKDIKLR